MVPSTSPEASCGCPYRVAPWHVSPQEDVLNTQCGYDVRLKLVRGVGTGLRKQLGDSIRRGPLIHKRPQGFWGGGWGGGSAESQEAQRS